MYYGAYYGIESIEVAASEPTLPEPVESPLETSDPAYVDHVTAALERLPQYAKAKTT